MLLLVASCLFSNSAFAQTVESVEVDGIYYNLFLRDKTAEVTINPNDNKYSGEINIPGKITYNNVAFSVVSIGNNAFDDCTWLTSIAIPNSITTIGKYAFRECYCLEAVIIPNSVTSIGNYAFEDCAGLIFVTIPNSVTSIGEGAFDSCTGLKKVIVTDIAAWCGIKFEGRYSNPLYYAKHLYRNETTEITNLIIPNSVTSIGGYAFCGCSGLTSVTIPNSVTSIGMSAFRDCTGLTSVTIPNSVTSIGSSAFCGCSALTSVTIPNSVTSIGDNAFRDCTGLTSVTIPNSVTSIGSSAFRGCSGLTSVTIPNSVTSIGNGTFWYCSGLTSVAIPNSVTSIGDNAFSDCSGLTSVTIPNSVTSIGGYAFYRCVGLTSVNIGNGVKEIGYSAFANCAELTDVYCYAENVPSTNSDAFAYSHIENSTLHVPAASIEQYKTKTPWSNFGTFLLLGESVPDRIQIDGIYYTLFVDSKTAEVTKNPDDKYIGKINIPETVPYNGVTYSVTSIGESAFENSGLTSITIPNSVTSIGWAAFCECLDLTSIIIPNSVTSIGEEAFCECVDLTSITIPNSVTSIGEEAFSYCSGLTTINVEAGNTVYDSRNNCNAIIETATNTLITGCKNTTIPNSVTSIGDGAFSGCSGLTSVTIPNSVTSIGEYAFCECGGLTSVNIGNSVKEIGYSAFADCAELTDVYCYAESVPSTKSDAFYRSSTENATLHVPAASIEQYKATKPWSNFGTIVPLTDEDAIAEVQAVPILIQTQGNIITVEGAEAGTEIILYGVNGVQLDSVIATTGVASLNASRLSGSVAIVKIGDKTVKVLVKH